MADAAEIRDYAQTPEGAGFDFTSTAGHTLGQPAGTYPDRAAQKNSGPFNDAFVTFAFLAGVTHLTIGTLPGLAPEQSLSRVVEARAAMKTALETP